MKQVEVNEKCETQRIERKVTENSACRCENYEMTS